MSGELTMIKQWEPSVLPPERWIGERGLWLDQSPMANDLINHASLTELLLLLSHFSSFQLCATPPPPLPSCFSRVRLWATPQMAAHQAPLSLDCYPPGSRVHGILQARIL